MSSFKSSSSSSFISSWRKSTPQFLTLTQWNSQVNYHPGELLYYRIEFNEKSMSYYFTKDNEYESNIPHPSFYIPLEELGHQQPNTIEEEDILLKRLQLSLPGMKSPSSAMNEVDPKAIKWLRTEASLIRYLKSNSECWRENGIHYRFKNNYTELAPLGALSKLILLSKVDQMQDLCGSLNRLNADRRKSKFQKMEHSIQLKGDDADYFLALPYNLFKGSFALVKEWLEQTFIDQFLVDSELSTVISGDIKYQYHTHLEWTALGAKYPWCLTEQVKSRCWLQTFNEDYSDQPVPFWLQDNQTTENSTATDSSYAILVTVAIYSDAIIFSIPAGKRGLNETCLDCLIREVLEETLLTFEANPSTPGVYVLSAGNAAAERIDFVHTCTELFHFHPNHGTDTFLFLYGDP